MKTLALETASQPGSVACFTDGMLCYEAALPAERRTTESFAAEIQRAFQQLGWRASDIGLFAVSHGPGSFTGLRIGITAAKTFAYAAQCDVLAVDTLQVLAAQQDTPTPHAWAVLDAQRRQLFVQAFDCSHSVPCPLSDVELVDSVAWLRSLPAHAVVTGSGLQRWQSAEPWLFQMTDPRVWIPQAATLGRLASEMHAVGRRDDWWQLTPRYYRLSAAEEKRASAEQ
jgi:tRNA threonylcarbamoyladenosine biosynthesis protein TsaB